MRGLRALQDVGLIGEVGVSNYSLARWRRAETTFERPVLSNQVRYSLIDRRPERDLISYAEQYSRVLIAYSPLAQGFLTGSYSAANRPRNPVRRHSRLFRPASFAGAQQLLGTLDEIARSNDAAPGQVALAWTIRHPNVVAIPGASSVAQLEQNAAAPSSSWHRQRSTRSTAPPTPSLSARGVDALATAPLQREATRAASLVSCTEDGCSDPEGLARELRGDLGWLHVAG